jgi:hypothetical protein
MSRWPDRLYTALALHTMERPILLADRPAKAEVSPYKGALPSPSALSRCVQNMQFPHTHPRTPKPAVDPVVVNCGLSSTDTCTVRARVSLRVSLRVSCA